MDQNKLKVKCITFKSILLISSIHFFHNKVPVHRRIEVNPNFAQTCIKRLPVICDLIGRFGMKVS